MNEKIKELAERAGDDWNHTLESDKQFLQKFAELIIRECAGIAMDCDVTKYDDFRQGIAQEIKQHFGVEE